MVIHEGIGISRSPSFDGLLEFLISEVIKEFVIEIRMHQEPILGCTMEI